MSLKDKLNNGKFVVTAEIAPPKGTDIGKAIEKANIIKPYIDSVNVTDNQRAVMRLSSLALCKHLLGMGIEPVLQFTCRDKNRLAIQSDLLGAHILGIRNVLVISGDHPINGDHKNAKPVYDVDSAQLIDIITKLNKGADANGNKLNGGTDFYIGAAVNPGAEPIEPQIIKMIQKIEHGAQFFQTQVIYDIDVFKNFLEELKTMGIQTNILAGVLPLRSSSMAKFLNDNVPGVKVPLPLIRELETSKDPVKTGIAQTINTISELKKLKKLCSGIHIMTVGHEQIVPDIVKGAGL